MLDSIGPRSSIAYRPLDSGEASPPVGPSEWRMEGELRRLNSELTKTRAELDILRATTAQVVTAILAAMQDQTAPVAEVPSEIRELAELSEPIVDGPSEDPITGETEAIDLTNQASLDRLDRRFRWGRGARKGA